MTANETQFRVRYVETDQMGMTHHSSYFAWFEVGRTEYMRQMGFPYTRLEVMGLGLPVVECSCRYHHTTRYDDVVAIRTTLRQITRARVTFDYEVYYSPEPSIAGIQEKQVKVAEGHTTHVFVNREGKPTHLGRQSEIWERLQALAQGKGTESGSLSP